MQPLFPPVCKGSPSETVFELWHRQGSLTCTTTPYYTKQLKSTRLDNRFIVKWLTQKFQLSTFFNCLNFDFTLNSHSKHSDILVNSYRGGRYYDRQLNIEYASTFRFGSNLFFLQLRYLKSPCY